MLLTAQISGREHVPGLPAAAALYCMQIWTINFSHTLLQTPTQIELYAGRYALTVRQVYL